MVENISVLFRTGRFSYLDVMKIINQSYQKSGVEAEEGVDTAVDFLLQYQETDLGVY